MSVNTPRIACHYADQKIVGRNDGGPLYHCHELRKLFGKENVLHVFPGDKRTDLGKFDLNYWVDWGEDAFGWTDFVCPKPNVYITSDTHLGFDYRLKMARTMDFVFCNQRKAMVDFVLNGIPEDKCFWLPHGYSPLAYNKGVFIPSKNMWDLNAEPIKKYDICFVGNLNDENRVRHLDVLFKKFPNSYWCTRRFHEAAEVFNQSKIVFNVSSRKELNMRHFEALGAGAFLLTDNIPTEENVFTEGVHFAGYDNLDDMVDKAAYYLANDAKRDEISRAGYIEAMQKHTYAHRVLAVLDTMGIKYDPAVAASMLPNLHEQVKEPIAA